MNAAVMNVAKGVWIVDDEQSVRWALERALLRAGIPSESFHCGTSLLARLDRERPAGIQPPVPAGQTS